MSSRTPILSSVAAVLLGLPAPVPLPVAASMTAGAETTLVVDLGAGPPAGVGTLGPAVESSDGAGTVGSPGKAGAVTVTRDGAAQPARLEPVVADGLAVTLVVDASAAGAETLPAWLSAAARFILGAPGGTRSVVIPDRAPAAALTPPQRGAFGVVRALHSVRASGARDTAAALDLALRQFPDAVAGRRVVLVYTAAPDAGGVGAAELAARYRSNGTILVVVGTAAAARYWPAAAAGTGGFFAPAGDPVVVPALDQVETTLAGRYLVKFPTPPELPARVEVTIETDEVAYRGSAVVPAPAGSGGPWWVWWAAGAGGLVLAAVLVGMVRARGSRHRLPPLDVARLAPPVSPSPAGSSPDPGAEADRPVDEFGAGPSSPHPMRPPALGRAAVPPPD
jgi:hypothetical protein